VDALACAGIPTIMNIGCADIALGRNMDITRGLERALAEGIEVMLLIDDDMVFSVEQVQAICAQAKDSDHPVSGIYCMKNRELAIWQIEDTNLFLGGLGFMAVSVKLLDEKAKTVPQFKWKDLTAHAWTVAGPRDGVWVQEDRYFCEVFGGVYVAPIIVGHIKHVPMAPSRDAIERILGEFAASGVV